MKTFNSHVLALSFYTAVLLAGASATAKAVVLYSSPADYSLQSFGSTTNGAGQQECTAFQIASSATITQVNFWGDYSDSSLPTDSFTIRLYLGSTTPGATALATSGTVTLTRTDTGMQAVRGKEVYFYTATLAAPLQISGGTGYSMAVLNAVLPWDWQYGGPGKNFYRNGGEGTVWSTSGNANTNSMQLIGNAVPEPSTWALFGLGAFGALGMALRRSASAA